MKISMSGTFQFLLVSFFMFCTAVAASGAGAPVGDGKLIVPIPGSEFGSQDDLGFNKIELPMGPLDAPTGNNAARVESLTGHVTLLLYNTDKTKRSTFEMFTNYEQALTGSGYQIIFKCAAKEKSCGKYSVRPLINFPARDEYYLIARGKDPSNGDILTVAVRAAEAHYNQIVIVRHKPMDTGLVKIDAAALAKGLAEQGHIALYGIQFDFGKATLKSESTPVLAMVAGILKGQPQLKLHVVGHTDNVGGLEANFGLSRARAASVIEALVRTHGIQAARLLAHGVASVSPVATNRTDEGRAKNRRVELVEM